MSAAQKTAILAQVGHFYFGAVGQFYVGANMKSGVWGRTVELSAEPLRFWSAIVIYAGLSLALLTVF